MNKDIAKARLAANRAGELTYIGVMCDKCEKCVRYTKNNKCYTCIKAKAKVKAMQTMSEKNLGASAFIEFHKGKVQYSAWI